MSIVSGMISSKVNSSAVIHRIALANHNRRLSDAGDELDGKGYIHVTEMHMCDLLATIFV